MLCFYFCIDIVNLIYSENGLYISSMISGSHHRKLSSDKSPQISLQILQAYCLNFTLFLQQLRKSFSYSGCHFHSFYIPCSSSWHFSIFFSLSIAIFFWFASLFSITIFFYSFSSPKSTRWSLWLFKFQNILFPSFSNSFILLFIHVRI